MILFLESSNHYKRLGLYNSAYTYNGSLKLLFGLVSLNRFSNVVFTLDHSFLNYFILKILKKKSINVIYVMDGVFEWNNAYKNPRLINKPIMKPCMFNEAFVCGDLNTIAYLNFGYDTPKVKSFVNPRVFGSKEKTMNLDKPIDLLITTANTPFFNREERERLVILMKEVKAKAELQGISFITRIFDSELLNDCGFSEVNNEISGSFHDTLEKCKAIITTPSSISLEAMNKGVRVAHFSYRDVPVTIQSAWNVHLSINVSDTIKDLCFSELGNRDEYQIQYVKEYSENSMDNVELDNYLCEKSKVDKRFSFIERLDFIWRLPYEIFIKK